MNATEATRRDFLRLLLASAAGLLGPFPRRFAWAKTEPAAGGKLPDLVMVKGGAPAQMFDAGIRALGGMGRFVKKGQTVLVKPNIGWNKSPTEGATTNPELVGRIVQAAYGAGAKKVCVFDHAAESTSKECYRRSGIEKSV